MTWPVAPINTLQYLKKDHIEESQNLQMGYYRDLIYQFGIPVKYFKHNTTYLKTFRPGREDYVRGENPNLEYVASADITAYVQVDNSIVQLTTLGLQTNDSFKVSFLINEFDFAFSHWLGEERELSGLSGNFQLDVSGFSANVAADFSADNGFLLGQISADAGVIEFSEGETSGSFNSHFHQNDYVPVINSLLYLRNYYNSVKTHASDFVTTWNADVDSSGNGTVCGSFIGNITYNKYSDFTDFRKRIRPQVGDVMRIETAGMSEDIEVTQVLERRPTTDGLNPLMKRYIWQLDAIRREVSHENMIGDVKNEVDSPIDIIDSNRNMKEYLSDVEFDYAASAADAVDLENSDRVYGQYGNYVLSADI